MATEVVTNHGPPALRPEEYPNVDHLVTRDDTPVDSIFSEKQQRVLTEPLYSSWAGPGEGRHFAVMANVGLFFAVREPPFVPDVLLSVDVEIPADLRPKRHHSYFVWEYGKAPDVVIEVVSNREGGEDTTKLAGYARVGVRYYVIYDPDQCLGKGVFRAYKLDGLRYRALDEPIDLPDVGLGLRIWHGPFEQTEARWLRWVDDRGRLVPTGKERADRLAERLRQLGVDAEGAT